MKSAGILRRQLEATVAKALRSAPGCVITGARQTGKSTLAAKLGASAARRYLTLDDVEVRERARHEPDALVAGDDSITIDEVQRAPELLLAIKRAIDRKRTKGRFLLTGSANLLLMRTVSETLAGRVVPLTLWPMTRRELLEVEAGSAWSRLFDAKPRDWLELVRAERAPEEDWRGRVRVGGYPTPAHEIDDQGERALWFAGYTDTYLERDLRDLAAIPSLVDFRRLMRAACLRIGSLVNQTELARDVGLSQPTAHRHLSLLEVSYQLVRLPAYSVNRTKRLIKTPKVYWSDTGLAMHLAGETEPRGAHLENYVLSDLLAWSGTIPDGPKVLYWRTAVGEEVDFVVEWRGKLLPIEVKSTEKPRLDDAKGLRAFRAEYERESLPGLVLHCGRETSWLAEGVLAAPWWRVI